MKKLLAILLAVTMLLAMLTVPTMAGEETPPAESATTRVMEIPAAGKTGKTETRNGRTYDVVTYNGKEYLVIRSVEDFLAMDDDNIVDKAIYSDGLPRANFILATNLDFTDVTLTPVNGAGSYGVITGSLETDARGANGKLYHLDFEGNGYALNNITLNVTETASGLFVSHTYLTNSIRHLTLNNVTFEGKTAGKQNCGIFFGQLGGNSTVEFKYVDVNVKNFKANGNGYGAYIGRDCGKGTTFVGCNLTGTFDFSCNNCHNGGFIGQLQGTGKVNFTDCHFDGNITSANNRQGGFIGQLYTSKDVTFTGCSSKGTFVESDATYGAKGLAGYVGGAYQTGITITFDGCTFDGTLTGVQENGAFVGFSNSSNYTVNFKSCELNGTVTTKGTMTNAYVGAASNVPTINYTTCKFGVATGANGTAAVYSQTKTSGNYSDVRVIMCIKEDYLKEVIKLDVTVTFGVTGGGAKQLALGMENIKTYSSVLGDGNEYAAPEGYVLMAVVVTDIDAAEWDKTMSVTIDAEGNENVNTYYDYNVA